MLFVDLLDKHAVFIRDTSISTLGNFMQVTLLFLFSFCFCIQRTSSVEIEITTFVPLKLCSTGEGLELDKTLKEWCCVVFPALCM